LISALALILIDYNQIRFEYIYIYIFNSEERDGLHLIKSFQARLGSEELLKAFLVMRAVWLRRDNFVFQGSFTPPGQLVLRAKNMDVGIADSLQEVPSSTVAVGRIPLKWRVPARGWLKLNWDAALKMQSMRMGIGIVVQNEKGEFVAAMAKVLHFINDPTVAEALAAWHAANLCVDRGFHRVVLEGDSLVVVSALNKVLPI